MAPRRPANPVWLALPSAAFATTIAGLVGHLVSGDVVWYEVALVASIVPAQRATHLEPIAALRIE